jgi:pyruvate dehydrogenase E1 component alpha subunit/2-oxoisovalerate dehydrogenase E1 component alpha subunit
MHTIPPDTEQEIYRLMVRTRLLEERLSNLYRQGKLSGGLYRSLGQEGCAVASAMALGEGDLLSPLIRNLGSVLARGVPPRDVFAQYLARATSPSHGKEGVLHFSIPELGIYAPTTMLGTMIPVLSGMVLGDRMRGLRTVGMTYIGDGGSSTGAFHEGINFAAVQKLPLVLVLEHNGWAYSTPGEKQCLARRMADKAAGYGMPGVTVDGNDVADVYSAARAAVDRARSGAGPTLLECRTYRMKGHAEHDSQSYVDRSELETWREKDPILRLERSFDARGAFPAGDRERVVSEEGQLLDSELSAALAAPPPAADSAFRGVFLDESIGERSRRGTFTGGLP